MKMIKWIAFFMSITTACTLPAMQESTDKAMTPIEDSTKKFLRHSAASLDLETLELALIAVSLSPTPDTPAADRQSVVPFMQVPDDAHDKEEALRTKRDRDETEDIIDDADAVSPVKRASSPFRSKARVVALLSRAAASPAHMTRAAKTEAKDQ